MSVFPKELWVFPFNQWLKILQEVAPGNEEFIYLSLSSYLGTFIGRRIKFEYAYDHFLNSFVCTVSSAGMGKSAILKPLSALHDRIQACSPSPDANFKVLKSVGSAEGLMSHMQGLVEPRIVIIEDELVKLITIANRAGTANIIPWLNDLYDGKDLSMMTKGQPFVVKDPCGSLIGAMHPEELSSLFSNDIAASGLISRIIFCPIEFFKRKSLPKAPDMNEIDRLAKTLFIRFHQVNQLTLSDIATQTWDDWYQNYYTSWMNGLPHAMQPMFKRVDSHALRFAAMKCFATGMIDNKIEEQDIVAGIRGATYFCNRAIDLYFRWMGGNDGKILYEIRTKPGISSRKLTSIMIKSGMSSQGLRQSLDYLRQLRVIRLETRDEHTPFPLDHYYYTGEEEGNFYLKSI